MSIFEIPESGPTAADLAAGFMKEADQGFQQQLEAAYDAVQRFWFRNKDAAGNPLAIAAAQDPVPTGVEILQAAGPQAQLLMTLAWARVAPLVELATALGRPELIETARLLPPYDLTFGPDGSLLSATLKGAEDEDDAESESEPAPG